MYQHGLTRLLQILDEIVNLNTLGRNVILTLEHVDKVRLATANCLHTNAGLCFPCNVSWSCQSGDTNALIGYFLLLRLLPPHSHRSGAATTGASKQQLRLRTNRAPMQILDDSWVTFERRN